MNQSQVSAIILAAGLSRRAAPKNKLLQPYKGASLIRKTAELFVSLSLYEVIVVTGYRQDDVRQALDGLELTFVHNENYQEGMGASLACGARSVSNSTEGILICLGDMPDILPQSINDVIAASDHQGTTICVPVFGTKRGHPVLFGKKFIPELCRLSADKGARAVIARYINSVREIAVLDPGILFDIDR